VRGAGRGGATGQADRVADSSADLRRLKKKLFGSWDRFEVPLPFSRACFAWGDPIWVPEDADSRQLEAKRLELEGALNILGDEADESVG
jgi:hypothetical protein